MANVLLHKAIISATGIICRHSTKLLHTESFASRLPLSVVPTLYESKEKKCENDFHKEHHVPKLISSYFAISELSFTTDLFFSNKEKNAILPSYEKREIPLQRTIIKIEDVTRHIPIEEATNPFIELPMEAAKSDQYWRRRRMKRHRLLRWRKKYKHIVQQRLEKKLENRKQKQEENLQRSWQMFGLTSEPPKLTEEEKEKLQYEWREQGIWQDPLKIEEYKNFAKISSIMKATDKKQ